MTGNDNQKIANVLTSEALGDMVLEHILKDFPLFVPQGVGNEVQQLQRMMDSLTKLAHQVASASLVNRQRLTALPTFAGEIPADPEIDSGNERYELRYRYVEQIGDQPPFVDRLLSLDEAVAEFGESFVDTYWGKLGEHTPRCVTTGNDNHLWFTLVRYPVLDMANQANANPSATNKLR